MADYLIGRRASPFALHDLLGLPFTVKVVDVGASPFDGPPPYAPLLASGRAAVVGFEPNPDALAELNRRKGPSEIYLPYAVADGRRRRLHWCAQAGMTSLLEPNLEVLSLFSGFADWAQVVRTEDLQTVRLDDMAVTGGLDMLKINIQGGELTALENAAERLKGAVLVQTGVQFVEMYRGQPLFADIDRFLRTQGFVLHRFEPLAGRDFQPLLLGTDPFAGHSQLMWAQAIYVRDFTRLDRLGPDQLLRLAMILHDCHQSHDLVLVLLREYDRRAGAEFGDLFLRAITSGQAPDAPNDPAKAAEDEPHPILQLQSLFADASLILCGPLDPAGEAAVERLRAAADTLQFETPEGSELAGWELHYRLLFEAIDLKRLRHPPAALTPADDLVIAGADGRALSWKKVKAVADRLGAQAVFFVAADQAYVETYAKLYVESVLKNCDVACLVVVHVIGGAGDLARTAAAMEIDDQRLIFTADGFDAEAVKTLCYESPPKGLIAKPVAHFQSVRFLRLKTLLKALKRPVFVSDIDLLLQRGVEDLIARCKDADVVLNENDASTNAGSRLTANLLLVNPTKGAERYLGYLESYLTEMLGAAQVTRWIDQVGLFMARLYVSDACKFDYFDTESDINNVMYRSYQENPFRFLSLYHGFDLSSLDGDEKPIAENAAGD